jgi:1-acyl-sn-glycerol-3-phosphate acyltransferase
MDDVAPIESSFLSRVMTGRMEALFERAGKLLHAEVKGIERLPTGAALLVANHTFGWDIAIATGVITRVTGRAVYCLGEHLWWKVPLLRDLAAAAHTVDGTPANVDRLLSNGELVLVLPGGLRESIKPYALRYRLLWGHRYGFIKAAIRSGASLVPLADVGADDVFQLVGDAFARGKKWLPRLNLPLPRPAYGIPLPHRAPLRYIVGEPIPIPVAAREDDAALVRSLRWQVGGALHELIDTELAHRAGIELECGCG